MATKRRGTGTTEPVPVVSATAASGSLLDVEALRQIVEMLETSDITRLQWQRGDERLLIQRGHAPVPTVVHHGSSLPSISSHPLEQTSIPSTSSRTSGPSASAPLPAVEKPGVLVTSPFVGTFYRTPSPDQPAFVDVGAPVKKGQVICIIEAMKLMNEIEAENAGRVTEILVQNAQPVEFGQPLFRIEPL